MIKLSQQDPKWSKVTLGKTRFTIGRYGCTTTCISMLSDYFQCYQAPDAIAKQYVKYTMDGLIMWETLKLAHMAMELRIRSRDDQAIQQSLKDPSKAVILNVNNGAHWVVALSKDILSKDYWVLDPWDGKKKLACKTYRNITGSAHFKLK